MEKFILRAFILLLVKQCHLFLLFYTYRFASLRLNSNSVLLLRVFNLAKAIGKVHLCKSVVLCGSIKCCFGAGAAVFLKANYLKGKGFIIGITVFYHRFHHRLRQQVIFAIEVSIWKQIQP